MSYSQVAKMAKIYADEYLLCKQGIGYKAYHRLSNKRSLSQSNYM